MNLLASFIILTFTCIIASASTLPNSECQNIDVLSNNELYFRDGWIYDIESFKTLKIEKDRSKPFVNWFYRRRNWFMYNPILIC